MSAFGRPTPSAVCRQGKARTRDPSLPLFIWYTTSFMSVWCIGKPLKTSNEAYSLRLGSLLLVCYSCPDSSFYSINCKPLVSGASLHFVARCLYIVLSSSSVFPAAGLFILFHHRCVCDHVAWIWSMREMVCWTKPLTQTFTSIIPESMSYVNEQHDKDH